MALDVNKVNMFTPAMTGVGAVNPFAQGKAQPVDGISAVTQGTQKYEKYDNNLQGKRGEVPNQYMGEYRGKENYGNLLAYC